MSNRKDITAERLREVLDYDPSTGAFTWKVAAGRVKADDTAGTIGNGYVLIGLDGRLYRAHRLAVLHMTGAWPVREVDHKDCNPSNNAWTNLREATSSQNMQNRPVRKDSRTGLKGVQNAYGGKFTAMITVGGRLRHLGTFATPEDAAAAYAKAANDQFGDFARVA